MYKAMALLEHKKKDGVLVFGPHEHPSLSIKHLDDEDDNTLSGRKQMKQHIEHAVVSAKLWETDVERPYSSYLQQTEVLMLAVYMNMGWTGTKSENKWRG